MKTDEEWAEEREDEEEELPTMSVKEVKNIIRKEAEIYGRLYLRPDEETDDSGTIFRLSKMEALAVLKTQFAHQDEVVAEWIGNKFIIG